METVHTEQAVPVPSSNEAVLDSLKEYSTYVLDYRRNAEQRDQHHGAIYSDVATVSDGQQYQVVTALPDRPIIEAPIAMTTAWFTSTRGHNRHTAQHLMRLGFPVVLVGPEGGHREQKLFNPLQHVSRLKDIDLGYSAHNMHNVLDVVPDTLPSAAYRVASSHALLLGESRGAMVGQGVLAQAAAHERTIVYADLTAPCFPVHLQSHHGRRLMEQVIHEPVEIAKLAGRIALNPLIYYPATVDPHPQALAYNIAIGKGLFSGEAGALANHIPLEQQMHITTFHDDFASMPHKWKEIFHNHANVRIKTIDGSHLTIGHPTTLAYIENRLVHLASQINNHGTYDPQQLDFHEVHLDDGDEPPPLSS